jgi:hypothetical protein
MRKKSTPVLAETPKPCENTGAQVCASVCTDERPVEMCRGGGRNTAGREGSDPENPSAAPIEAAESAPLPVGKSEGSLGGRLQSLPRTLGGEPLSECLQLGAGGAAEMDGQGSLGDGHSPDVVHGDSPRAADFGASRWVCGPGEKSVPDTPTKEETDGEGRTGYLATHVSPGEVHRGCSDGALALAGTSPHSDSGIACGVKTGKCSMDGESGGANEAKTGVNMLLKQGRRVRTCRQLLPSVWRPPQVGTLLYSVPLAQQRQ